SLTTSTTSAPEIPFDSVEFGQLPSDMYMGEASGVATDSHGNVYVFSRGNSTGPAYGATAAQLLEFDSSGKFMREIGHNLYAWGFAHSVRIDPQDNIWVADKGSDMVVRFNQAGRVTLVLGRKTEASDADAHPWARVNPPLPPIDGMFRQVTDMTWDPQGNIYVADGYVNSRVAKFDPQGNWLTSFGERGNGPGQFRTVHSIAADKDGNLYVADRSNRRIQVLDDQGHVKRIITIDIPAHNKHLIMYGQDLRKPGSFLSLFFPGAPWAVCITPPKAGSPQYLFTSDAFRIFKMTLDGHVLGWLGGEGKGLKEFGWIHGLACPDEHTLYAAELVNWRVQKLTLHPIR
ncbi:MAG: peptidyl-alpha-hydroxyglycine alpha-amidating lyase family protein, partial [Rhizomicrobium sp.]